MIDLISQSHFCFIRMSIVDLTIGLGKAVDLVISKAVLTETDVTISFFELSL